MARTCPRINAPSRSCDVRPSLGDIKTWTEVNCSRMLRSSMSSFYLRTWSVGKHRASWNADMSIKVQVVLYLNHSKSRFQYVSSNLNCPFLYVRNPRLVLPILSSFAGGEDQACLEFHSPSEA